MPAVLGRRIWKAPTPSPTIENNSSVFSSIKNSVERSADSIRVASPTERPINLSEPLELRWQSGAFVFTRDYTQDAQNRYLPAITGFPLTISELSTADLDNSGVGVYGQGNRAAMQVLDQIMTPFRDAGVVASRIDNTGGTDHLSFDRVGVPGFQFIQDPLDYGSRVHHTSIDTYDHLKAQDLRQAPVVLALHGILFGRVATYLDRPSRRLANAGALLLFAVGAATTAVIVEHPGATAYVESWTVATVLFDGPYQLDFSDGSIGGPGGPGSWSGLLGACGRNVVFGQHVVLRHPHKIRIGDDVVIDDHCLLDAKGESNGGIAIGRAHLVSHATLEVAHYTLRERDVPLEVARFEVALSTVRAELEALHGEASAPGSPSELAALVGIHAMFLDDPLLADTLASSDGTVATLLVTYAEMSESEFAASGVQAAVEQLVRAAEGPERIYVTGIPALKAKAAYALRHDTLRFTPLSAFVIVVVLLLAFRTARGVLVPVATTAPEESTWRPFSESFCETPPRKVE